LSEEKKEISFEEWVKLFNADKEELSKKTGVSVERILMMMIFREAVFINQHFDWILDQVIPELKIALKQDIRTQKKLLKGLR